MSGIITVFGKISRVQFTLNVKTSLQSVFPTSENLDEI